jgi:sigma-B regulation protein RsbU (phosphoserine phosphatase)
MTSNSRRQDRKVRQLGLPETESSAGQPAQDDGTTFGLSTNWRADGGRSLSAEEQLANLRAVTDSTLGRLAVENRLSELMDRIRSIVDADTAAVLLLDREAGELVAWAACGVEEEVGQGVRVPIGAGFAGRIARSKKPVLLNNVDPSTVSSSMLWEKGIRAMLGVPLFVEGKVIGVLRVGRLRDKPFGDPDVELLQIAAERVAGAAQARELAVERAATSLLLRSLLPGRLPTCPGLEFATRYLTPDEPVGGDWYDVFTLPSGQLWVVTGDVAGHGVRSAVVMGRVRSALRSYALISTDPREVLELTSRKVQHFEMDTLVTAVCVAASPPYREFRVATAGHPPPLVVPADGPGYFVDLQPLPPLGVRAEVSSPSTVVTLPAGAAMVLYTDGLIERRGEALDAGMERLRGALRSGGAEAMCSSLVQSMLEDGAEDDVAVVVVRRSQTS